MARRARRTPDRVAVIHAGDRLTYAQMHDRVTRLAHGLRGLGAGRGDRVAYLGPNHPAFLETLFAAGTLGAILVPLNTRLAAPELARHLTDSGSRTLIYGAGLADTVAALRDAAPDLRDVVALGEPASGELGYAGLLAAGPGADLDEPVGPDDPCLIMYTSGTTGGAKGATLSHGNITWNALNVVVDADFRQDEVALVVAPLFHTAALNMLCLPTLLKGGAVLIEPGFEPGRALELIESHRVTSLFGVPAVYDAMAAHPRWPEADLSSLRMLLCGGAPVPEATIRGYTSRGLTFIQGYGMTETSPGALLLDAAHVETKAGSAGVPHFFTEVQVVRPDLTPAPAGETGEIVVAGPNVMQGYWGQPARHGSGAGERDLAAVRGRGDHRRRRLRVRGGPDQGHDHLRRGERLPGRGGERAAGAPCRRGLRRDRRTRRPVGRGRPGRGGVAARRAGHRGGTAPVPGRQDRPVQDPEVGAVRRRTAADRHRQDPQEAAAGDPRPCWPGGATPLKPPGRRWRLAGKPAGPIARAEPPAGLCTAHGMRR